MHMIEFVPAHWLERSAWAASGGNTLLCYSRLAEIERRVQTRRTSDVELLLKTLLSV
jgi:hypothetical protein